MNFLPEPVAASMNFLPEPVASMNFLQEPVAASMNFLQEPVASMNFLQESVASMGSVAEVCHFSNTTPHSAGAFSKRHHGLSPLA